MKPNRPDPSSKEVPKAVVSRLSLYLRELQLLIMADRNTISSTNLGRRLGLTAAQVRKDFAYFGQFGYPGIGYRCEEMVVEIKKILGTDRIWNVALVGCGNLGQALLGYRGFQKQGFQVVAAFDVNDNVVGSEFYGLKVQHLKEMVETAKIHDIRLAILAVPSESAHLVVDQLVEAGITGILNFAPVTLSLPKTISVVGVDLAMELEQLAFAVVKQLNKQ